MDKLNFLSNLSPDALDELYQLYKANPEKVDEQWHDFFKGFEFATNNYPVKNTPSISNNEFKVSNLILAYRQRGHLFTHTNPVRERRKYLPTLHHSEFGLTDSDLNNEFYAGEDIGLGKTSLQNIISHLETTYCRSVGVEYMYIRQPDEVQWLKYNMESTCNLPKFEANEKKQIYQHLVSAVGLEKFIHQRFAGQKRFSLEGAEALIPSLDAVIEHGAELGISEFIIGMSHRGRLNVLANIMKKPHELIFREFTGKSYVETISLGDVKYHLGYGNDIETSKGKKVRLNLAPNPSHLEAVGPVVQGIAHAKIKNKYNSQHNKLAPIIIHGDAAIAGQGVVYEVVQMAGIPGYQTGGTIHLVVNNQVGFTTSYLEARTSTYCTDIAKVTRCPVFHVNGDDVESLVFIVKMAMEYRQKFHKDVFIDILSYRKYGHNEGDEPRFTQPVLYKAIATHPNPRDLYGDKLIESKIATRDELMLMQTQFETLLDSKLDIAKLDSKVAIKQFLLEDWHGFRYPKYEDFQNSINTNVSEETLRTLANKFLNLPNEDDFFKKATKLNDDRKLMVQTGKFDWAMGELLAYASLLANGIPVRLSGQDSQRGTFSHRHAVLVRETDGSKYFPLQQFIDSQASFEVYNSPLNEYGVLGFEYGYALATPKGLNIWEAQFGDFHNVAQVIVDQYISSAEEKWGLMNGLVLMLPHGYEGQGPEHSSARTERFINLCARNNMQLLNCTTPANLFHALRQQVLRDIRTPMVIFTPKSLLRHPQAVSDISAFSTGKFMRLIDDAETISGTVSRVVLCSGKIYYDLLARKTQLGVKDIALVRVEQIYPFPKPELVDLLKKYPNTKQLVWVQEEPMNMGAWYFVRNELIEYNISGVFRSPSGSPAVGLNELHHIQQTELIDKVFKPCTCDLNNIYCGLQCKTGSELHPILKQAEYFSE